MQFPASYIALDIETTGLNLKRDRIVEIACITVIDGVISETKTNLVNPGKTEISEAATKVHGITKKDLEGFPHWTDLAWDYFSLLDNRFPIVTFNGKQFDIPILEREFDRADVPIPGYIQHFDCYELAKERLALGSYKQGAVAEALHINVERAHSAPDDAAVLVRIFEGLKLKPLLTQQDEKIDPSRYSLQVRQHADLLRESKPGSQAALQLLSPHIVKIAATCERASLLDCEDEDDYRKTVEAELFLKKLEKSLTKLRTESVREMKTVIKEIEKAWRDLAINPIKDALKHIENVREPYLYLQHQQKLEAKRKADEEARRIAAQAAEEQKKLGRSEGAANAYAKAVEHEAKEHLHGAIEKVNRTQTRMGSASAEISYSIRIIDPDRVPRDLWSPDEKKILAEALKTNGADIPGVELTPVFTHRTRSKRR